MLKSHIMPRSIPFLIFTILFSITAFAQKGPVTYTGMLDKELAVDMVHVYKRVWGAADVSKFKFAPAPEKGAVVSVGELIDIRKETAKTPILLVEPAGGGAYFWIDVNENGVFEKAERFQATATGDERDSLTARLNLPITNPRYKAIPIYISYLRGMTGPGFKPTDRLIEQSVYVLAMGHVEIGGRRVLFQYPFSARQPAISTTDGLFGVDVDGDGRIRDEQFSRESSYAANDEVVFPFGEGYVSTSSIDMATGKIVVQGA